MIARVSLEIALRREFDYAIPPELADKVDVGSRVQVPFGPRKVLGVVTAVAEESAHANLKPILKIIGAQTLVTPKVLKLARWIADYYCCAPEIALKSVLPEAVRKEDAGWLERLFVRVLPPNGEFLKLPKRQQEVWNIIEERREILLSELVELAETTAATVRKLEDRGLVSITSQVSERDPYAKEIILASQPLTLNSSQAAALEKIKAAMELGSTLVARVEAGVAPATPGFIIEPSARRRNLPHFEIPGSTYHITWQTHDNLVLSPEAREKTLAACHFWHGNKMKCHVACVMPDHVHLLLQPLPVQEAGKTGTHSLSEILHSIKSFSAHEANKVMQRKGPVWMDESSDRMIRSESDLHKTWNYIWNNPRKIGLVGPMEEYPYIWTPPVAAPPQNVRRDAEHHPRDAGATRGEAGEAASSPSTIRHPPSSTFLLHGVTGSGKTEVYLQAIAHALEQGKGAIVLVPEISLTPQTVERFKARFSSGKLQTLVAVLHSHLSAGERHDEWHKIRQGRARIVIGARSAIFAPVEPLGLIIVDEEHEHTYKQEESPRYHARDVAVMRGQMEDAVVVLGSATPSLESFYNCKKGKFTLLELPERVDDQKMPRVRVVDMRQAAYKEKGPPIFTPQLKEAITQRLEKKEQTILFLNRRGYSSSLVCEKCGHVCECPNCSLALTYHRAQRTAGFSPEGQAMFSQGGKMVLPAGRRPHVEIPPRLLCHICGYQEQVPTVCPNPKCKNPGIRYSGLGTQKVEDVLGKLFPHARIRRMDADVMKRKEDYRKVLDAFKHGDIDILIGTQMIAKGLHFPNVTLVGIIYADMALHQPDFRAGERTFQLLTQVAGRAGRGDIEGEVFVQAFTPFHPAIQYARRHDFNGFFDQELEFRKQLNYPPFSRVAMLTLKGRNEEKVKFSAEHLKREIEKMCGVQPEAGHTQATGSALQDPRISGPAPAPLLRAETFYRYQIMLRTRAMSRLSQTLAKITATLSLPDDVTLAVDIDPVDLS
jgi:primosomal protein N' (replication factor Y)